MEGRTVVFSVVIMTLVLVQIQVDAKLCCPSESAQNHFKSCALVGIPYTTCLVMSGCKSVSGDICPPGYPNGILKHSAQGDAVNEYCKLGCAFSVCGAMNTLQNSDANEFVNGAVEQCTKACSTLCNKGSLTAVKSA
ncbi:unnamed protein product [Thlaspi arvense]|uniref:Thionin n=1 Tax=Thlaspi arvense TaxID=13288 RepID=A0AAU9RQT2_THLAR|nr:unnamed protein product [Thlaspi arvense]